MADGRCCEMVMSASLADDLYEYIFASCKARGLYVYEDGRIIGPDIETATELPPTERRWWKHPSPDFSILPHS